MKRLVRSLLVIASVLIINFGFATPIVHFFWTLSGYEVVQLIPRWVGREFYILLLIPICSGLLLFSLIPFFWKKTFVYTLLILLNVSFLFSLFEIIHMLISGVGIEAFSARILNGYYLLTLGTLALNIIIFNARQTFIKSPLATQT